MSIIFSRKCEYGIQAVLLLTVEEEGGGVHSAEEIAGRLKIPKEFVSKILQELAVNGIIYSKKGKSGGFSLAKSPKELKLLDVVLAIDGPEMFNRCVLGFPNCSDKSPCPVHHKWSQLITQTFEMLSDETIDQFKQKTLNKIESIK
ncbi:MAG: Rrf2 family transcriptional regulator [Ignavibacteriaceae bacterium]|nr:Rrf2 family transcriptional regulator [Ignavibacteriaceae bacterium]HRI45591.1 Rrf2 family transcriptional regulator [Ignavibacteriaceae bacterium]